MRNRIITILIIIAATIGYSVYQKRSLESQLASEPKAILSKLPDGNFETLEGQPFDVHDFVENEAAELLVVHFWGTWCAPCEAELPDLLAFMKRFEDRQGVKFLLVAANDNAIKVKKHIKTQGVPKAAITWLIDNNNVHRDLYGTTRVPETYVFSSDKSTLRKYTGPQEWNKPLFFRAFDEFLLMSSQKL